MLRKSTFREIKNSFSRWIAILAIVALGVGFFCGLKVCKEAFWLTGDEYILDHNFFDFELISTLGIEEENVTAMAELDGVEYAEGSYSSDALYMLEGSDGTRVAKFHAITSGINTLKLMDGRMPETTGECIVDANRFDSGDIGKHIIISDSNEEETQDLFTEESYEIVGLAESPLYLNYERGSTSLGNGSVSCFIYIPMDGWDSDVYTEMYVSLNEKYDVYSDEYDDLIDRYEDSITLAFETEADSRYQSILDEANEKFADAQKKLDDGKQELAEHEQELQDGKDTIASKEKDIETAKEEISDNKEKIEENKKTLADSKQQLDDALQEIESQNSDLEAGKQYLPAAQYNAAKEQIDQAMSEWTVQNAAYEAGIKEIEDAEAKIADAEAEIADGEEQLLKAAEDITEAEEKISDAKIEIEENEAKLKDAREELDDLEAPDTYVLGRETNIGYVCFENDTNIVDGIAKVFPAFFFLVAALVVMTTMTRMVAEQRTQIGVLKALGYAKGTIMAKYLFYSMSAAVIGGISGFIAGSYLFPWVIWTAYGMMYGFSQLHFVINWTLGGLSILAAILCVSLSTLFAVNEELTDVPAELIRPKAPAAGKRILLERIHFIWDRLPFLHKVSARNIFRYKKRFFMMILGIAGCTALLITGFGISDSIKNIVDAQYDNILKSEYIVTFKEAPGNEEKDTFLEDNASYVKDAVFLYTVSMDASKDNQTKSVNLVVIADEDMPDNLSEFIDIHTLEGEAIKYPGDGECVINSNLGLRLGLEIGDTVTLSDSDMNQISAVITAECENYMYNYMYITADTYENQIGEKFQINSAYVRAVDSADVNADGAQLMKADNVSAVTVTNDFRQTVAKMMSALDYVVLLVIFSAGALAFIVLYDLTNINITERIREIATIKVLGFYKNETAQYVFRENIVLTAISALCGIPLGKLLHSFVMNQIVVDLISFDIHVDMSSYIYSVLLTFVFAFVVNLFMAAKLDRINMAESLKSIE